MRASDSLRTILLAAAASLAPIASATAAESSAAFPVAPFIQDQRERYAAAEWDRFFGAAQGYRLHWWRSAPSTEPVLLEILALTRLCRHAEAESLLEGLKQWTSTTPNAATPELAARLEALDSLIPAASRLKVGPATKLEGTRMPPPLEAGQREDRWPGPQSEEARLLRIPPEAYRARVESRCP